MFFELSLAGKGYKRLAGTLEFFSLSQTVAAEHLFSFNKLNPFDLFDRVFSLSLSPFSHTHTHNCAPVFQPFVSFDEYNFREAILAHIHNSSCCVSLVKSRLRRDRRPRML